MIVAPAQRQHVSGRASEPALESAHHAGARRRIEQFRIERIDVHRKLALFQHPVNRVLKSRLHATVRDAKLRRHCFGEAFRIIRRRRASVALARDQIGVPPHRLAVAPPGEREGPARRRLARIPFAEPVMQQPLRREFSAQPACQFIGQHALALAERRDGPFGRLIIVDRHEGRLAAHREPHVVRRKVRVDLFAERVERRPRLIGKRPRDARRLGHARDAHLERERRIRRLHRAGDRRGGAEMRRWRRAGYGLRR